MSRTAEQERADVLAFLDDAAACPDAFFRAAGAYGRGEADAMRSAIRSARKTLAQGAHEGMATKQVRS